MSLESATGLVTQAHAESTRAIAELLEDAVALAKKSVQYQSSHRAGPFRFRITANERNTGERLTSCLVAADTASDPDLEIFVLCGSSVPHLSPPAWNLAHTDTRHLERLHLAPDGNISAFYDNDRRLWMILNRGTKRGLLWAADNRDIPFWEDAAPFKLLLHWFLADTRFALVHGGAVAAQGRGLLLTGPGGSGKSTTVAACFQRGMEVCGDDLVMVEQSDGGWRVHAVYDAVKLVPGESIFVPAAFASAPARPCGTKRLVRYSDIRPQGFIPTCSLGALVHCVIADETEATFKALSAPALLCALAPATAFLLRGRETETLRKIGAMVRTLPCLRLELGKDPAQAAALIEEWLREARA